MMNRQAIAGLMDRMRDAFGAGAPGTPDERARELWFEILEPLDVDTAEAATRRAVVGLDRHPTIHQFLDLCVEVESEEAAAARAPDVPDARGPLPAGMQATAKAFIGAVKAGLKAGQAAKERGEDVDAAVLDAFDSHRPAGMPAESHRSRRCSCDDGMVAVDADTVRPCDRCRPGAAARWAGGHYELGHTCSECAAR